MKNTYPLCTVSFYKTGTFSSPVLLMLNILFFFYRFEAENILVLLLKFLNVVSVLACIGLSMYRS